MPIDASIPLQVQNVKVESPMNQLAMVGDAMKIGEMARGVEEQNKLNEYLRSGVDLARPEARQELVKYGKTGLAYGKALAEQEKAGLETKKLGVEIGAKQMEAFRERMGNLAFNPSNANIQAHLEDAVLKGEITPQEAQQRYATTTAIPIDKRANYFTEMGVKTEERYKMAETQRHNRTTEGIAGGHLALAREAAQGVAQTLTDAAGNVTLLDKQGNIIKKLDAAGKPSATFEKTAALQKQQSRDLSLAINELTEATKDGGLIDKSTGSGAGRLVDVAAGFAGQATPGAIAIAKLKPIADIALKMVPRFEGPQSDKDTASYKEAAGQLADASLPTQIRKEAGREVLRLMKARKGQFVNEVMANEGISAGGPAVPSGFEIDK